jgi:CheY-like chemotaxis protein
MDLTIPGGMGGGEAMRELLDRDPDCVALVSSGYSADPVMANYAEHGFRDAIRKPYDLQKLSNVLSRALGESDADQ